MANGIYVAKKKDNSTYYRVSITYKNKHISLGSFDNDTAAKTCYEYAKKCIFDTAYTINSYSTDYAISFEKWVTLINFRDNRIYFKTPIYLLKTHFLYYISHDIILKFDRDDLFYYSGRKISKRGGHIFVYDYGMQYNILNRYGIISYAVPGRDYIFNNGDYYDFRYRNITIINSYRGVRKINDTTFEVYIHVSGNVKVGTYKTIEEAAIAYNKAADLLSHNSDSRKYQLNYVENILPKQYADIYSRLKISDYIYSILENNQ